MVTIKDFNGREFKFRKPIAFCFTIKLDYSPEVIKRFCSGKFAERFIVTEDGVAITEEETFKEMKATRQYGCYLETL